MQVLLSIVAVFILATGIVVGRNRLISENLTAEEEGALEQVSEENEDSTPPSPDLTTEKQKLGEPKESVSTSSPTASATPSKTPAEFTPIEMYKYPNSAVISLSANSLNLTSNEDVDKITNWYKSKVVSEGMNVKTFIVTKTNDNVLNKLVGASSQKEVRVDIKKDAEVSVVQITVSIENRTNF